MQLEVNKDTMKTFTEWMTEKNVNERAFLNQLFRPSLPPMNPKQRADYEAMRRSGMGHEESLARVGISLVPGKNPPAGEESMNAGWNKGTTGSFMTPQNWDKMKAPGSWQ